MAMTIVHETRKARPLIPLPTDERNSTVRSFVRSH